MRASRRTTRCLPSPTPRNGPREITPFVVKKSDKGASLGAAEKKFGIKGSQVREVHFDHTRVTIAAQAVVR
jgi:alkylation response protein AidB-like acyl-CoA dehydrogenase